MSNKVSKRKIKKIMYDEKKTFIKSKIRHFLKVKKMGKFVLKRIKFSC
ncbi:hypothetical protein RIEPE_A0010 (plasmid) [Candidatus Riesia pediculicola USDA]|uniref:Uncharacterized protein n=1 Tax=Riesia pediculicola (strain USDA) TaxID=515618 RepID=D4G928_RIEPU|nr:hypothetical protein RIEPE_A0010 [Candidatus Riesia pediculicola USDA]